VIEQNPGSVLVSGAVLQEAIEKTFDEFVKEQKQENKIGRRVQRGKEGNQIKEIKSQKKEPLP